MWLEHLPIVWPRSNKIFLFFIFFILPERVSVINTWISSNVEVSPLTNACLKVKSLATFGIMIKIISSQCQLMRLIILLFLPWRFNSFLLWEENKTKQNKTDQIQTRALLYLKLFLLNYLYWEFKVADV